MYPVGKNLLFIISIKKGTQNVKGQMVMNGDEANQRGIRGYGLGGLRLFQAVPFLTILGFSFLFFFLQKSCILLFPKEI